MSSVTLGRRIGNAVYKMAFPAYRPIYSAFKSYTDRAERHLLAQYISDGAVVVDAGANVGVYSRFFSGLVGPMGRVHSFEPSPENFARLLATAAGLLNVRLNQMAVSDATESKLLYISENLNVDHRTYPTEGEVRPTILVKATKLDDYFKPGSRVDLIKADIQGYELHALRGSTRVLDENRGIKLLLEFWPYGLRAAGCSADELLGFLHDRDFKVFSISDKRPADFDRDSVSDMPSSYQDLFAMRI